MNVVACDRCEKRIESPHVVINVCNSLDSESYWLHLCYDCVGGVGHWTARVATRLHAAFRSGKMILKET